MMSELDKSIENAGIARDILLSNKIEEARDCVADDRHTDMYAAMAYCNIGFMQAVMTFDRDRIAESLVDIDTSLELINSHRHKDGLVSYLISYVRNRDFTKFTELEKHAELCYAEMLLHRAILTFAEEADSLVSFVKGAFKIKTSHSLYKELYACLSYEEACSSIPYSASSNSFSRELTGGIKAGWGFFLLGLSLLPPKIVRMLEFVGLQGDKEVGLALVVQAEKMEILRSFVVAIALLNYETIALQFIGTHGEYDDVLVEEMLRRYLSRYPGSVPFTFFSGRRCVINSEIPTALEHFQTCENSPIDWVQVYHLCYWEMMWCYAMLLQWDKAADLAHKLFMESKWSRTLFGYQYLSFQFMSDTEAQDRLEDMAKTIPKYQLKIGGKHLHIEKFAIRKARSFLANDGFLIVPGVELLYIWRFIPLMRDSEKERLVQLLENNLEEISQVVPYHSQYPLDDWFLCSLLLAVVTAELGDPEHALSLLRTALQSEDSIQVDHHYIPYAHFELGQLYVKQGEYTLARAHYRCAKEFSGKVKSYSLENRLLFRIHSAMSVLPPPA